MFLTQENGNENVYLITRRNEYFLIPDLHFPKTGDDLGSFHTGGLIDGELVVAKKPDGSHELKYLIFDCLALDGNVFVNRTLNTRLGFLTQGLYKPYQQLFAQYPEDCKMFPFKVYFKKMERSYGLVKVLDEVLPNLEHASDGLIFTCRVSPYVFGTDPKILKWKPPEENTVDFRLVLEFPTYTDPDLPADEATYPLYDEKPECHLYAWFGGTDYRPYDDLYITDEEWDKLKDLNEPLHERLIECNKDDKGRWRYLRFRDDKPNANHISTIEKVNESIRDCVTKEELTKNWAKIQEKWKERERAEREKAGALTGDRKRQRSST